MVRSQRRAGVASGGGARVHDAQTPECLDSESNRLPVFRSQYNRDTCSDITTIQLMNLESTPHSMYAVETPVVYGRLHLREPWLTLGVATKGTSPVCKSRDVGKHSSIIPGSCMGERESSKLSQPHGIAHQFDFKTVAGLFS